MLWFFCFVVLAGFTGHEWIDQASSPGYELCRREISFNTTIPVQIECSYPIFHGHGTLIDAVNLQIKTEAEGRFASFFKEAISEDDLWEDECMLSYALAPVYQTPHLISIFGCAFQGRGSHGCTYYEGLTFWQNGESVVRLGLDDLFIKRGGYRQFLLQYCENEFKASGYGYYSSRPELPPELSPSDLDACVLTNKGLRMIFRAYTVGGWADGPDTVLIPYIKLKEFIDPFGPLKELAN
jgi:hypothetical protein